MKKYNPEYYRQHRHKILAYQKDWRNKNAERIKARRREHKTPSYLKMLRDDKLNRAMRRATTEKICPETGQRFTPSKRIDQKFLNKKAEQKYFYKKYIALPDYKKKHAARQRAYLARKRGKNVD